MSAANRADSYDDTMHFALLGDHADGLAMAHALTNLGRHELTVYSGPAVGLEYLRRWGLEPRRVGDLEEVLADPSIAAVIVAGAPALRPGQLRRALQSERHVLCVCPVDDSPDLAYEAAMTQADTGMLLFPLLPEALHPGYRRLAQLARSVTSPRQHAHAEAVTHLPHPPAGKATPPQPAHTASGLMTARLVEIERWSAEEILLESEEEGHRPGFPGWDVLRLIGGEVAEVAAFSGPEEVERGQPVLLAGQFVGGGLFQASYVPLQADARVRVALVQDGSRAELIFPQGWPGPARLSFVDEQGRERVETWEDCNPWLALAEAFEAALQENLARRRGPQDAALTSPTWQDAIRGLELDDAARRSVRRRRVSTIEYQEVTEEAGFKGTMTLVGCSMIWISLMLLILSAWVPWLGWIIAPVFGIFLLMQLLRWVVPGESKDKK